jgi:hypothetical protein
MQLFRSMACKQVEAGDHDASLTLSGTSNTFLYQAYLGRVEVKSSNSSFDAFVDDDAVRVGTTNMVRRDQLRDSGHTHQFRGEENDPNHVQLKSELSEPV